MIRPKPHVLIVLGLLVSSWARSDSFPGNYIPLAGGRPPATDLTLDGQILLPDEAIQKAQSRGLDLSDLNPPQDSQVWKLSTPPSLDEIESEMRDTVSLQAGSTVKYVSDVASRTGNFRVQVEHVGIDAVPRRFTVLVSKKSHNVLLRAALLRKLGYQIPAVVHLPSLRIRFSGAFTKKAFLESMADSTLGTPDRWVIENKEDSNEIVVQDVVAFEALELTYNFAHGFFPADRVLGRRLINALLIPYALTDVPESVNLMSYTVGRVFQNHVNLNYEVPDQLSPSVDDARWIAKRVAALTRSDWQQIVASTRLPEPVARLLLEKLIGRRNHLVELLDLKNKVGVGNLSFNPYVSLGTELVNGKLLQETWPGYGSRFAFGDPKSPFSGGEIGQFVLSKALSTAIDNGISALNSYAIPHTNIEDGKLKIIAKIIAQSIIQQQQGGQATKMPLQVHSIPFIGPNVTLSRDLIVGSYLGTDNLVQLADTIGLSLDVGVYFFPTGLPISYPISLSAKPTVSLGRTYSHIQPVTSIKAANKTPFKNMLVPMTLIQGGKLLDDFMTEDFQKLSIEEQKKKLSEVLKPFKEKIKVGESLLVTDTLSVGGSIAATIPIPIAAGFPIAILLQPQVGLKTVAISRLNITRKDEDTFQVYRDNGELAGANASLGVAFLVPVVSAGVSGTKLGSDVKYFPVSLEVNDNQKPVEVLPKLLALKQTFLSGSSELLERQVKPFRLKHSGNDLRFTGSLFVWQWLVQGGDVSSKVWHPDGGEPKWLYRASRTLRSGVNFETYVNQVAGALLQQFLGLQLPLFSSTGVAPQDTLFGQAALRVTGFETELDTDKNPLESQVTLTYQWRGWKMSKKRAQSIVDDINDRFGKVVFTEAVLANTQSISLYNLQARVLLSSDGLEALMNQSEAQVRSTFKRLARKGFASGIANKFALGRVLFLRNRLSAMKADHDYKGYARIAMKLLQVAERRLTADGLFELVGGQQNLFVISSVDGFRNGDEAGDQTVISNTLGQIGNDQIVGPVTRVQRQMGMNAGEFYLYWLMGVPQ